MSYDRSEHGLLSIGFELLIERTFSLSVFVQNIATHTAEFDDSHLSEFPPLSKHAKWQNLQVFIQNPPDQ